MMNGGGAGGGLGGLGSFPAPGVPGGGTGSTPSSPGTGAASAPPPLFNPWFPPPPSGGVPPTTGAPGAAPSAGAGAPPNPYASMFDPAAMQQMLGMLGGGPALGGFGAPPAAPADSRPPEERFQVQLQVCFTGRHLRSRDAHVALLAIARHGFHQCTAKC